MLQDPIMLDVVQAYSGKAITCGHCKATLKHQSLFLGGSLRCSILKRFGLDDKLLIYGISISPMATGSCSSWFTVCALYSSAPWAKTCLGVCWCISTDLALLLELPPVSGICLYPCIMTELGHSLQCSLASIAASLSISTLAFSVCPGFLFVRLQSVPMSFGYPCFVVTE